MYINYVNRESRPTLYLRQTSIFILTLILDAETKDIRSSKVETYVIHLFCYNATMRIWLTLTTAIISSTVHMTSIYDK